jgi:dolichyl-phosphate beta-glucosyltransferase
MNEAFEALTIVVPAYNEARRLPILLRELEDEADRQAAAAGFHVVEVIVVDDGSTDETPKLLAAAKDADSRLRIIRFERNRGKGAAVRAGILAAAASHALVTDVDLSTPLCELSALAGRLRSGSDVAVGSRGLPSSRILLHQPPHRELMGKSFNLLLRWLTGVPYRDTQCGFKLFDLDRARVLFDVQKVGGFAFDAELCVNATRLGLRLAEVPVTWVDHRETKVRLFRSSARMALDLFAIAWRAHRPLRPTMTIDWARVHSSGGSAQADAVGGASTTPPPVG